MRFRRIFRLAKRYALEIISARMRAAGAAPASITLAKWRRRYRFRYAVRSYSTWLDRHIIRWHRHLCLVIVPALCRLSTPLDRLRLLSRGYAAIMPRGTAWRFYERSMLCQYSCQLCAQAGEHDIATSGRWLASRTIMLLAEFLVNDETESCAIAANEGRASWVSHRSIDPEEEDADLENDLIRSDLVWSDNFGVTDSIGSLTFRTLKPTRDDLRFDPIVNASSSSPVSHTWLIRTSGIFKHLLTRK